MNFALATFCYGERYYNQANRMIQAFEELDNQPSIFIVTDDEQSIKKNKFVFTCNINEYNSQYNNYAKNYYDFDFSVKRFSLKFALDNGFNKIILADADTIPNPLTFNSNNILNCFSTNSVSGPVNYFLEDNLEGRGVLGHRLWYYCKKFNREFKLNNLLVSEDCIQYFDIETSVFNNFLLTWNECIDIKYKDNLPNIPAGNIDEISFCALYHQINLINNSNKACNLLNAYHDKWYA